MAQSALASDAAVRGSATLPLARQSALEHIARLVQSLRRVLPQAAASEALSRRSDVLLRDIGLTREEASRTALWRHSE